MNHYDYLQEMCNRFPTLFGLECTVYQNMIIVKMTDGKGTAIIEKEMHTEGIWETKAEIDEIKSQCAYDIICSLCLAAFSNIKKSMANSILKQQAHLN